MIHEQGTRMYSMTGHKKLIYNTHLSGKNLNDIKTHNTMAVQILYFHYLFRKLKILN